MMVVLSDKRAQEPVFMWRLHSIRALKSATRWERRLGLVWMYCVLKVTFASWTDCETRHVLRRTYLDYPFTYVKYYAVSVFIMSECYAHWWRLNSNSKNCGLSLGCRHSVVLQNPNTHTPEKMCVWCVFESHTHSVSVQKLSHWYYFEKWCPGAESNHRHEDFQ